MKQKKNFSIKHLLLAFCLLIGFSACAQQDSTMAKNLTDKMKSELSLTDDQYSQVLTLNQNFIGEMKALKSSGGGRFSKFKKMKAASDDRDKQMKQILTSDQYSAYLKYKAENKEKFKEAYKSGKGDE